MAKAVVLLSGGLDSATALLIAQQAGYDCYAISLDYGQRHVAELVAADAIAKTYGVIEHRSFKLDLAAFGGSSLTDQGISVPDAASDAAAAEIPNTYVPARNTIMLSVAMAWAEVLDANAIYTGMNAVDYSGYPDCRPAYVAAFQAMADLATKAGVEGHGVKIQTPLIELSKGEIIRQGTELGLDYGLTVSCYRANAQGEACGRCDSCDLRRAGFEQAGVSDPTRYAAG